MTTSTPRAARTRHCTAGGPPPRRARFSKYLAEQVYGSAPHHSYVWGGSGGGRRSPLVLENAPDVFDGALPFMGGGDVRPFPATERIKGAQVMSFACMFNVQRMLRHGDTMEKIIDAMQPGGSGDPFEGLDSHVREELASLYRQGFPRGDEFMIATPMGQIWLWSSIADLLVEQDPSYFEDFWTKPGYIGHDLPSAVEDDVIDVVTTVSRVITVQDLLTDPAFDAPEYMLMKTMAGIMAGQGSMDMAYAVEVKGLPDGYRLGAGLQLKTRRGRRTTALLHRQRRRPVRLRRSGRGQPRALQRGQGRATRSTSTTASSWPSATSTAIT